MKIKLLLRILAAAGVLCFFAIPAQAQWITQSFNLKAGWNAVFFHVDASYATIDDVMSVDPTNPIQEVWLWNPSPTTGQFVESPQLPTGTGSQWVSWLRTLGPASDLVRLTRNVAGLVRVSTNVTSYTWNLKGKPVPPQYQWTTTGLNFLGFPTVAVNPPSFDSFLAQAPELQQNVQIFQYMGGDLGPGNPARLYALRTTPVRRGEAFWIRSGDYFNRYFAPYEVVLQNTSGMNFRDSLSQYQIRLRNITAQAITVTAQLLPSESPPSGQTSIVQVTPLLVRGAINTTNLTYGYASLTNGPQQWTLQPSGKLGSEVEVVFGIDRSQMPGNAGDLYAGVLRLSDSLNFSQVDIPVSANVASMAGLWVGGAGVNQVRHYLKSFEQDSGGNVVMDTNGAYVAISTNTTLGTVARPMLLRLILHQDGTGKVVLLQRVYCGVGLATNAVVATRESLLLKDQLASARRISAVQLPWSASNNPWTFTGALGQGASLTTMVDVGYDDQASNPFLHTYHPDHDNLNATFDQTLDQGQESYGISRQITLTFTTPGGDFASVTSGSQNLTGTYDEQIILKGKTKLSGTDSRQFDVRGSFTLNRISDISTLTK